MPQSDPYDAAPTTAPPFPGFRRPNYTPVPDELFDDLLVELSGAELKVLLYIIRRTFGFKRDSDAISISQMLNGLQTQDGRTLDHGVGLSKKTLLLALRTLEERRIILTERRQSAEKGNEPTAYWLNVLPTADWPPEPDPGSTPPPPEEQTPGEKSIPPLGEKLRQGVGVESTPPLGEKLPQGLGGKTTPSPWGKNSPTQETVRRETVEGQTVHGHTVTGQTAQASNGFELLATMQQTREPSRFSKTSRFGAFSQRAAGERSAALTPPAEAPAAAANAPSATPSVAQPDEVIGHLAARLLDEAAEAVFGGERPQTPQTASAPGASHAAERPKTGRSGPKTAGPASRATPLISAPDLGQPPSSAEPRSARQTASRSTPPPELRPARFQAPQRQSDTPPDPAPTLPAGGSSGAAPRPQRTPPPPLSPYLEGLVTRYSEELHDEDHIPQNLGQAGRLWQASGWSEADFGQALHEAKAITVKRDIKKRAAVGGEFGARNKMPYYFKVLRDMLGLNVGADGARQSGLL